MPVPSTVTGDTVLLAPLAVAIASEGDPHDPEDALSCSKPRTSHTIGWCGRQ